jgi:hypothetical protein
MARINVVISDGLDGKFRKEVARRLGMKKGNIQKAMEEAISVWLNKRS